MKSYMIGGIVAILAAFLSIFGVNLQKLSHNREELRARPRPYHKRPLWWLGMSCVVGASLGDFFALGFAPQTLVASLGGGSTILGNCLMSRFWLKQSLYITDVVGVAMVTLGVVILAAASEAEGHYKMEQIYQLMQAAPFILYCFVTTAFVTTLYMRVRRSKAPALRAVNSSAFDVEQPSHSPRNSSSKSPKKSEINSAENTNQQSPRARNKRKQSNVLASSPFPSPIYEDPLCSSPLSRRLPGEEDDMLSGTASAKLRLRKQPYSEGGIEKQILIIDPKLPLYWAAISGTIGAQSVLLAKCVAEMIFSTIGGANQFVYFGTYVLIGGMVITTVTQTHTLNLATMAGDTMSSYPVFQAFWITMSNISGVVFFQQAHNFNSTQWTMFPSSLLLVLAGIYLISKHEKFGNRVKYSVAMPISLSSPRQHDIVAQSFVFRVLTPQRTVINDDDSEA